VVERRDSNRKVRNYGSASKAVVHHCMLFPILGPSSLPVVVAQPDERHANRTVPCCCWSGMTDTEHTAFGSNEEEKEELVVFSIKTR